jgi:RNA polymerase sigma-70 factor (ECF subfamily)
MEPVESGDSSTRAAQAQAWSDEEVVERVLAGEPALFEIIMRRYNQRLFRTVRGMGLGHSEAEDILQETYVRAYQHLRQFEKRARFSTWLMRIAIHEGLARQRRHRRFTDFAELEREPGRADPRQDDERTPEDRASSAELRGVLEHAIGQLPESLRLVFVLREVEGFGTEETSDCLGITVDNVKVRLHRARSLLRARIDRRLGAEVRLLHQFAGEQCDRIVAEVLSRLDATSAGDSESQSGGANP